MESSQTAKFDTGKILKIPLLSSLPREECDGLLQAARVRRCADQEVLFEEGDASDTFVIILEGGLEVIKNMGSDAEMRLAQLGEGDYVGEMSLFLRAQVRSASIRAIGDTHVVEIPRARFEELLKRQPELAFHLMQEMSLRMRNQDRLTAIDLRAKNQQLQKAYDELKAAQAQIIQQEKLKHELAMARSIQEGLLPKELPNLPGWRLAAHWEPARSVGGDFYDFIHLPGERLGIVVGDVTDKGVPAALVMANTHSVLRAVVNSAIQRDGAQSPAWILAHMNDAMVPDMPMMMFVTCLIAILDPLQGRLRYATAGHPPPIHCSREGAISLPGRGVPLGLFENKVYEDHEVAVAQGDFLLLFSDALLEAHNPQEDMFGDVLLMDLLRGCSGEEIVPFLLAELAKFTHPRSEPEDDVTLVSLLRV